MRKHEPAHGIKKAYPLRRSIYMLCVHLIQCLPRNTAEGPVLYSQLKNIGLTEEVIADGIRKELSVEG